MEPVGDVALTRSSHPRSAPHLARGRGFRGMSTMSWHEEIKAAALRVYGDPCGAEIERVNLDNYRGMDPDDAIEAIVKASKEPRNRKP